MKNFYLIILVPLLSLSCTSIRDTSKPNIILVMADDQGWGDTGYNGHPFVKTSAMDDMAQKGFVFERFYAGAPVCSPTRASVLTGRTPIRTKVTNHGRYMRPQELTIAEILKNHGYKTGIFGKVHLGSGQPDSPCNPGGMGFDEWTIGLNFFDNDPYLSKEGKVKHYQGKGSVILMDEALKFLNKHKNNQPVFAVIWFPSPHDPFREVPNGPDLYEGKKNAPYYREITLLDQQLGRLREELRRLNIVDNTILWYCSDNGGLVEETSGGREKKGSIYEGGLLVPSIIEWPAKKISGKSKFPASTCDMLPTLLAMAEIEEKLPHPLDGIDVSKAIYGKKIQREKAMGFWHKIQNGQSTWNDRILKDIMNKQESKAPVPHNVFRIKKDVDEFPQFSESTSTGHAALNDWPWKLHRINGDQYELYNLEQDPMEKYDLSKNSEHSQKMEKMKQDLNIWMKSVIKSLNGDDYKAKLSN